MLFETGRNREDVGIEDDVGRVKSCLLGQNLVRALADRDLALDRVRLAHLVERHDDDAGPEALDDARLVQEVGFAFLEADRVDDALALHALETGLDDRPPGTVDHHRHARNLGLGRDVTEERRHGLLGVEHALVHVDVDQVRAVADLLGGHLNGSGVVVVLDEARELRRSRDVCPLADHLEVALGADGQCFETGELGVVLALRGPQGDPERSRSGSGLGVRGSGLASSARCAARHPRARRERARRQPLDVTHNRPDVVWRRPAASADDVHEPAGDERLQQPARFVRLLVVLPEGIRQPGVGVTEHVALGEPRELFEVRAHLARAERAVHADRQRPGVADRGVECVDHLA